MINLNCALVLFTVCRNLITRLRATFLKRIIPFDSHISMHFLTAGCIVFWTFVHVTAHYFNLHSLQKYTAGKRTMWQSAFLTGTGFTGHIMLLSLVIMIATSFKLFRHKFFHIFWNVHHLSILFIAVGMIHGAFCFIKSDTADACHGGPGFWKWTLGSFGVYLFERLLRVYRARQETSILKVIQHPSQVFQVQIRKPSLNAKSGQYIYICCPEISKTEWHPFTLTSSPSEDFISVHIRVAGDWTKKFAKRLGCVFDKKNGIPIVNTLLPEIKVDGPYGSASEDVYDYDVSVIIGAGIGVVCSLDTRLTLDRHPLHLS